MSSIQNAKSQQGTYKYVPYLTLGIILIIIIESFFFVSKLISPKKQIANLTPEPKRYPSTAQKEQLISSSEINQFPVYPVTVSGKKDGKTYTWVTYDSFVQVVNWYRKNRSKSAWNCMGGKGNLADGKNAKIEIPCTNGSLSYNLQISADGNKTSIILTLP